MMKQFLYVFLGIFCILATAAGSRAAAPVSEATSECLGCHESIHPGIVEDWKKSRHAMMTPGQAMKIDGLARKVSSSRVPKNLETVSVGCAECHLLNPDSHSDTFDHNGYDVHAVVSPRDCAACHSVEAAQFSKNIMSHARNNLAGNAVYQNLQRSIIGQPKAENGKIHFQPANAETRADSCFYCHGTELKVKGTVTRDTDLGEMDFPDISGWPNQGVGRINPDGSAGTCSACHTRHQFSIEMARKPHTCKECHIGPDVPAYKVYSASKHGNIYAAMNKDWNFKKVPWTIGKDFGAPTCAACHISLLVDTEETPVVQRTHQMSDRLSWRIFGLIYAHPHPENPDTTLIRNKDGLPLATDFEGGYAGDYLIDADEMADRTQTMQSICLKCHDASWVEGHWKQYENTIRETNRSTLTATGIMTDIWSAGYARGVDRGGNPFDELPEKMWSDIWLFYANTIRFSSAMAGGGDYGAFANGRYFLSKRILELSDWLKVRQQLRHASEPMPKKMSWRAMKPISQYSDSSLKNPLFRNICTR